MGLMVLLVININGINGVIGDLNGIIHGVMIYNGVYFHGIIHGVRMGWISVVPLLMER